MTHRSFARWAKSSTLSVAFLVFLGVAALGCATKGESRAAEMSAPTPRTVEPGAAPGVPSVRTGRDLVVTVDLGLTVDDVPATVQKVRAEVEASGGYVANASVNGSDDDRHASLELRIPSSRATDVRARLGALGEVTTDSEHVEDVTEARADVKARLANARVQEARIKELLATKASSLAEVLEAEKELARVRESIERLEAEERTVDGRVALATVHLTLGTRAIPAWKTPGTSIQHAAIAGGRGAATLFVYGAMGLATVLPSILPFVALAAAVAFAIRRARASRRAPAGA